MEVSEKKKQRLAETAKEQGKIKDAQRKELESLSKTKGDIENKAAKEKNAAEAAVKTVEPTVLGRLVRKDNVSNLEAQGWNTANPQPNKNVLGVRGESDLVLMEKKT